MEKIKVLFLCIHNSARSQMAEAYLKQFGGERFFAESAGLEAGNLNPYAVEAMMEDGIDISNNKTKDVFEFFKEGRLYNYVITVCDEGSAAACPLFPGVHEKMNWSFEDPSQFAGTYEERLQKTKEVRDLIKQNILQFIKQHS
ncbi:MAG: arsenate reductase ArsC [Bacteroidota bacterium]